MSTAATSLCTACGLCCNGVLFHLVRLQPGDSARGLTALGMKLRRKKGQHHFNQPCGFLEGCRCTIYAQRPERCRLFECRQLQKVAAGESTEAEAQALIGSVLGHVTRVEALLSCAGNAKVRQPLAERYARVMAEPCDPAWDAEGYALREALRAEMTALNAILNADFRLNPVELAAEVPEDLRGQAETVTVD